MRTHRRKLMALAVIAACVLTGACGTDEPKAAADEIKPLDPGLVPAELEGLVVSPEEVSNLANVKRPFVDALGLYSLRAGEQLQATLQVSRFTPDADAGRGRFREAVVQQIGSTVPKPFRMGEDTVFLTTGRRQSIGVWFRGRHMFVLAMREEYERPRALLRRALEIQP